MKEWKDKEVIIGLIIIIILGAIALFLLIKRELRIQSAESMIVEEVPEEITEEITEEIEISEAIEEEELALNQTEETESAEKTALANVQIVTEETSKQIAEAEKNNYGLYDILGNEKYASATLTERKQDDNQLKELYEYWDAYKLDAVDDLIRLERLQKISEELDGTNKYYYYGSFDRLGRPSGKGLAVYEDNTYYFGEWKEGLRHGKGMWLEVAIYQEENKNMNRGLIEHSYNGQWSKDLPNGEGQEHFSYDYQLLSDEDVKENQCVANVIGGFKDGYYHGEMYLMVVDKQGNSRDWNGTCNLGVWEPIMKGNTTDAVWETSEKDEEGRPEYHYMYPQNNKNYGIMGLKK